MIKKIIFMSLLLVSMIHAATLNLNKTDFTTTDKILVSFSSMTGKNKDWIGIYPKESNNNWENVVKWHWTNNSATGQVIFDALPIGEYEARAFYNNSFKLVAKKEFDVKKIATKNPSLKTNKTTYSNKEKVIVSFNNMAAKNKDWIGIYPEESSNAWENVVAWHWTNDTTNGQVDFNALPAGKYEVRAFYNNSFKLVAKKEFIVEKNIEKKPTISTNKANYFENEKITISFNDMSNKNQDWIAIYPKDSSTDWGNVVAWKWTNDITNGQINFNALPAGNYEVRAFYNNSFDIEAKTVFTVIKNNLPDKIVLEDAEDGLNPEWKNYAGPAMTLIDEGAQGSNHAIRTYTGSGQYIFIGEPSKRFKYLALDVRVGVTSHNGNFTVYVKTKNGTRRIVWSVYLNHLNGKGNPADPFISGDEDNIVLNNPAPSDYFFETKDTQEFVHYEIDVEKTLKLLEPENELLSIQLFTTAGGDFDNIALLAD